MNTGDKTQHRTVDGFLTRRTAKRLRAALNIGDLRRLAKKRLPKIIFDYVDTGLEDEDAVQRNIEVFRQYRLVPRYLIDVQKRSHGVTLMGTPYGLPFGIAPTGMAGICRHGADEMLAAAAVKHNIPFVVSGNSTSSLETVARIAPQQTWYQLYASRRPDVSKDLVRRTDQAGISTLVVTVDVPVTPKRENNIRNGWVRPYRPSPAAFIEALCHPDWIAEYLRHGLPYFENWRPYAAADASPRDIAAFVSTQIPASETWKEIEAYRKLWPRKLVLKGLMHPTDVARAAEIGVDGVIISNHGGRQLDRSPAPAEMVQAVRAAVSPDYPLMFDGGIQRGADVATGLCLGANFAFVGRATLYGAAAAGSAGIDHAIKILREEFDLVMGQVGCTRPEQFNIDHILDAKPKASAR